MERQDNRRQENRLDYRWPVWFSEDFTESMPQGLLIDISSGGISFDHPAGDTCLRRDQPLTVRFSIPRFQGDDPTATISIIRAGHVCRIDEGESGSCRVAVRFDVPLALRPTEVTTLASMCTGRPRP